MLSYNPKPDIIYLNKRIDKLENLFKEILKVLEEINKKNEFASKENRKISKENRECKEI